MHSLFNSSSHSAGLFYLSCYVSPLIMLPSCEWRVHKAWGCMCVRVFTFQYACKYVFRVFIHVFHSPKLWHSRCNPPLFCCLTLCNLWPMSTWTFKICHFPQMLSAGGLIYTTFRHELHGSSWRNTAHEIFKSVKRFAELRHSIKFNI